MPPRSAPAQSLIEGSRRFDRGTESSTRFDELVQNLWTTHCWSRPSIVHSIKDGLHKITIARNPRGLRQIGEPKIFAGPDISHNLHDYR
jgi:hypothetical protein